jgi:tripartite-type tricarboxylate transporter receptor subunit TctC
MKMTKEPAFVKFLKDQKLTIFYRTGQQLSDYVAKSFAIYEKLLKETGLAK